MDDSVFKDDSSSDKDHQPVRIDHSKHNGYGHITNGHSEHNSHGEHNHVMTNGKTNEHEQMSKMSSKNREIFEKLVKMIKQPGISEYFVGLIGQVVDSCATVKCYDLPFRPWWWHHPMITK